MSWSSQWSRVCSCSARACSCVLAFASSVVVCDCPGPCVLVCACLVCLWSSLLVCARVCSPQLVCARALLVCARVCFSWPVCARVSVFASFVVVCARTSLVSLCSCLLVCARPSPCERVLCPFVLVCARPGQCVLVCASYFTCLEGSGMRSGVDAKDCGLVLPVVTLVAQTIAF